MGKMTKLLNKPLRAFALYSMIILVVSAPVYVSVIEYIWISELDENNWLTLQHTKNKLLTKKFTNEEIEDINHIWGSLQPGVSIVKSKGSKILPDSVYDIIRPNEYDTDDGEDRFRGLKSFVLLNNEPYVLTIETNFEESDETLAAVSFVTCMFFIALVLGFIFINHRIAIRTWNNFYQTLKFLKSFELSKQQSIHLPESDILEFQELNHALLLLINNNINTYRQQQSFIENASHELQTPIALLKSKMDLLLQQKDISPQISELLVSIEAPLSRLSRINKNLLVLARVENMQFSDHEQLDLTQYLQTGVLLFEDYLVAKRLHLENTISYSIVISANSFLIETLVYNLLSNAIRHTPKSGEIKISGNGNTLYIANTGKESLDESNLFKRFAITTKDMISSGLGLAIIYEIVNKYGWKISYRFEDGFHIFMIRF